MPRVTTRSIDTDTDYIDTDTTTTTASTTASTTRKRGRKTRYPSPSHNTTTTTTTTVQPIKITRDRPSIQQKLLLVNQVKQHGIKRVAQAQHKDLSLVYTWMSKENEYLSIPQHKRQTTRSMGKRRAAYPLQEQQVYDWILTQRSKGHSLSLTQIRDKMRDIVEEYLNTQKITLERPFTASCQWANGFKKRFNLSTRVPTQSVTASQWSKDGGNITQSTQSKLSGYKERYNQLLSTFSYPPEYIVNCDETPVWMSSKINSTVDVRGKKQVAIKTSTNERERVTVMLACTRSGLMLPVGIIAQGNSEVSLYSLYYLLSCIMYYNTKGLGFYVL